MRKVAFLLTFAATTGWPATQVNAQKPRTLTATFEKTFEWTRPVDLQETTNAVNASPAFVIADDGRLLVSDMMAGQVRSYDSSGKLLAAFGRKGGGPGEFRRVVGAHMLGSGELLTVDTDGRLTRWSEDGRVLGDASVDLYRITSVTPAGRDSVLMVTVPRIRSPLDLSVPVLHVVDVRTGTVLGQTLRPNITLATVGAWTTVNLGSVLKTAKATYVTLPLVDSLFVFSSLASTAATIPLTNDLTARNRGIPDAHADRGAFERWLEGATFVSNIFGDENHGFCVQLLGMGTEPNRGILYIAGDFSSVTLINDAPVVLGFDKTNGEFLFDNPELLEPRHFRFARTR